MSAWNEYVTAALIGVEKSQPPGLPAALDAVVGGAGTLEPEAAFLTRAGALALWRSAGWIPPHDKTEIRVAEPETTAPISRASVAHLRVMLDGQCAAVLPEWLGKVAQLNRHVPPELLPALLNRARQERALRDLVSAAGGRRVQWLASHNPDWAFAPTDAPDAWETGSRDQRVAVLRQQRVAAPADARARLEATWKAEPAETRASFLTTLEVNLSIDDTPFLDTTLDDRSKEVRRAAIDLLARLPSSAFVTRMVERGSPLVVLKPGRLLSRASLDVSLPPDPDAVATRDGLDPKAFGQQKALGEKAVLLVLILSAIPLAHWTGTFQQSPAAIVKAAEKNEFARALATGWAWAALRQRDAEWAAALLDGPIQPHGQFLPAEPLAALLPLSARASRLAGALRSGALNTNDSGEWHAFAAQLNDMDGCWPAELAAEFLAALRRFAANGIQWHYRATVESLVLHLPPSMLADASRGWATDKEGITQLVDFLTFRHEALNTLTQS